jgi:dTDP-4-amino-4,6-dideoxygalactose transaminase
MKNKKILFNIPYSTSQKIFKINKIKSQNHFSGSGSGFFTKKCTDWLIKNIKCKEALLVHSCTAALEMCAILLNIKPGDEIIMPSYTFVSTANAFVLRGGKPVFVDVDCKTLNIDPKNIEKSITKNTKAIIAVHYAGISCDMEIIMKIARKHKLFVVEDAAQSIMGKFKKKQLGSIGDLATLSFHETKNIHCGEGGALLINNKKFIKRAKIIRDKGTNRDDFNNNLTKKYSWVDIGSSYCLSEINASFLFAQLKLVNYITRKRVKIWNTYHKYFEKLEIEKKIIRPFIPKYAKNIAHMYWIIIDKKYRNKLIGYLKMKNINSLFHYIPLHSSPFNKKTFENKINLKVTDSISKSIIRMPLHLDLKKRDITSIATLVKKFFEENYKKFI